MNEKHKVLPSVEYRLLCRRIDEIHDRDHPVEELNDAQDELRDFIKKYPEFENVPEL